MRKFFHFPFFLALPPPPPPPLSTLVTLSFILYSWKFIYFTRTFYADFYTLCQYGLRIRNQCNSIRIAVIFTAHTLRRATLFPQRILFKIRADKKKKKKRRKKMFITQKGTLIISIFILPQNVGGTFDIVSPT